MTYSVEITASAEAELAEAYRYIRNEFLYGQVRHQIEQLLLGQQSALGLPAKLVEPCILAGCPKGGTILDPFAGRGTTGVVAEVLERNAVLVELNPVYVEMQEQRETVQSILKECSREGR